MKKDNNTDKYVVSQFGLQPIYTNPFTSTDEPVEPVEINRSADLISPEDVIISGIQYAWMLKISAVLEMVDIPFDTNNLHRILTEYKDMKALLNANGIRDMDELRETIKVFKNVKNPEFKQPLPFDFTQELSTLLAPKEGSSLLDTLRLSFDYAVTKYKAFSYLTALLDGEGPKHILNKIDIYLEMSEETMSELGIEECGLTIIFLNQLKTNISLLPSVTKTYVVSNMYEKSKDAIFNDLKEDAIRLASEYTKAVFDNSVDLNNSGLLDPTTIIRNNYMFQIAKHKLTIQVNKIYIEQNEEHIEQIEYAASEVLSNNDRAMKEHVEKLKQCNIKLDSELVLERAIVNRLECDMEKMIEQKSSL
jgi:hypothetical protein